MLGDMRPWGKIRKKVVVVRIGLGRRRQSGARAAWVIRPRCKGLCAATGLAVASAQLSEDYRVMISSKLHTAWRKKVSLRRWTEFWLCYLRLQSR